MKSTNVAVYRDQAPNRCCWCLKPAWSNSETCRACRGIGSYQDLRPTQAHALTGGRWVVRGGVKVWQVAS